MGSFHRDLSGSLKWSTGDLGLVGGRSASTGEAEASTNTATAHQRRRAQGAAGSPPSVAAPSTPAPDEVWTIVSPLLNVLLLYAIVLGATMAVHGCAILMWRHRINRRYYRIKSNPMLSLKHAKKRFVPLPSPFVFPCLPMVATSLFSTGIVSASVKVLVMARKGVDGGFVALAACALVFVFLYQSFMLAVLFRFHRQLRQQTWRPLHDPEEASLVIDPFFRLMSRLRVACRPKMHARRSLVKDRPKGRYAPPSSQLEEPARTERLLAAPVHPFTANAADTLDLIGFSLMARAGGDSFVGVSFEFFLLNAQMVFAALTGLTASLSKGSAAACTVLAVLCALQLLASCYVLALHPSSDRLMSLLLGLQFLVEGVATLLLLLLTVFPDDLDASTIQNSVLALALLSLFGPVLSRFYDAVIVQLSQYVRRDDFSLKSAFFAFVGVIVFLPTAIAQLSGFGVASDVDTKAKLHLAEHAADQVNAAMDMATNDEMVRQIEDGLAQQAANRFWAARQHAAYRRNWSDRKGGHLTPEQAALFLQQRWRMAKRRERRRNAVNLPSAPFVVDAITPEPPGLLEQSTSRDADPPGLVWLATRVAMVEQEEARADEEDLII